MCCSRSKAPKTWKTLGTAQESAFGQLSQITSEWEVQIFPDNLHWPTAMEPVCHYSTLGTEKDASENPAFIVLKVERLHITLLRKNGKWLLGPKLLTETGLKNLSHFISCFWSLGGQSHWGGGSCSRDISRHSARSFTNRGWEVKVAPAEITDGGHRVRGWWTHFSSERVFVKDN